MARTVLEGAFMRSLLPLFLFPITALALVGCSDVFDQKGCTAEARMHVMEMSREVPLTSSPVEHEIEGCLEATCRKTRPDPNGKLRFGDELFLGDGAFEGEVTPSAGGSTRVTVRYSVVESSTRPLTLRVLAKDGKEVFREQATPTWAEGDCHPPPTTTKL